MTEPTDAELDELRQANDGKLNFVTLRAFRAIARAVLAKWGTPAPVGVEPVAWLNPWRADQVTTDYDAYGEHGIPLYTTPQPTHAQAVAVPPAGREPLPFSPRQRERLFNNRPANVGKGLALADWHRVVEFIEAAHDIKGGQHDTDN